MITSRSLKYCVFAVCVSGRGEEAAAEEEGLKGGAWRGGCKSILCFRPCVCVLVAGVLLFGFRWGVFEASSMSKLKTERNV